MPSSPCVSGTISHIRSFTLTFTIREVERIVGIFKNHGIDKETGKRVKENVIHDFFDEIDDLMGYEGASEVIFVPEEYGLDKEATIQEIVDYILENQNIG